MINNGILLLIFFLLGEEYDFVSDLVNLVEGGVLLTSSFDFNFSD